jgi:dynamin-like GTPase MGM1, mitochondrial
LKSSLIHAEFKKASLGWISEAQSKAGDLFESASETWISTSTRLSAIELPAIETPRFLRDLFSSQGGPGSSEEGGREDNRRHSMPGPEPPKGGAAAAVAAGAAALSGSNSSPEGKSTGPPEGYHDLMHLTRKLIGIRSILISIDQSDSLKLPSIVVIGSQSSGKSSVLEAIVGHQFLPKCVSTLSLTVGRHSFVF